MENIVKFAEATIGVVLGVMAALSAIRILAACIIVIIAAARDLSEWLRIRKARKAFLRDNRALSTDTPQQDPRTPLHLGPQAPQAARCFHTRPSQQPLP